MIRRAAVLVFVLTLGSTLSHAQEATITIEVPSAEVHSGPTTVTPVIGHVARGTVVPISRNLGSWVKIAWPQAPEGVGYVHITMGHLAGEIAASTPAPAASTPPPPAPTPIGAADPKASQTPARVVRQGQQRAEPVGHLFAVGGVFATTRTVGATARTWQPHRLGLQLAVTRETIAGDAGVSRVTATQIEPGVLYGLFDRVTDDVWIRPYVGSAVSFLRQTSDNGVGMRVFGGTELTLAAAPQLGLSADVGYRRLPALLPGYDASGVTVSIAAHWYVR